MLCEFFEEGPYGGVVVKALKESSVFYRFIICIGLSLVKFDINGIHSKFKNVRKSKNVRSHHKN